MPGQLRSPRTFCLHCGRRICADRLRAHKINPYLFGFCSPVCELNFGVSLHGRARVELPVGQRDLLERIHQQHEQGKVVAVLKAEDVECLGALARKRLIVRHGRLGASSTMRGDISYICSRLMLDADPDPQQDPRDDMYWYFEHGHGLPIVHD